MREKGMGVLLALDTSFQGKKYYQTPLWDLDI